MSSPSSVKRFKNGSGKVSIPIRNTWTHKFFLCASSMCSQVPTTREKIQHGLAGLGERDIVFQKDGNAEHVQKKLIESYPVLKECGGFSYPSVTDGNEDLAFLIDIESLLMPISRPGLFLD